MKTMIMTIFLCAAGPFYLPVHAADSTAQDQTEAGAEKKFAVRFVNISLPDLLKFLSRESGLGFRLTDPKLNDMKVTYFGRKVSASSVMELLVKTKDLEFQRDRNDGSYLVKKAAARTIFTPLNRKDLEDPLLKRVIEKVRVKDAPLSVFLDIVSVQSHVNFVIDNSDIKITTELDHTTVADILQFLKSKGLEYSRLTNTNTFVVRSSAAGAKKFAEAEAAFSERKYEAAAVLYRKIYSRDPQSDMADYALLKSAVSYDWQANRDNAPQALKAEEEALRLLIKNYSGSPLLGEAYLYLGQIYSGHAGTETKMVDCKQALEFYALAIENSYKDWVKAQATVRTGQCYELAGSRVKALAVYGEAAAKYPDERIVQSIQFTGDEQRTLLNSGIALEKTGEYDKAMNVYSEVIKKYPSSETANTAAGRIQACQSKIYADAPAGDCGNFDDCYNHAGLLVNQSDCKGAIALYTKALSFRQDWPWTWYSRGIIRKEMGELDGAKSDYAQAVARAANDHGFKEELASGKIAREWADFSLRYGTGVKCKK